MKRVLALVVLCSAHSGCAGSTVPADFPDRAVSFRAYDLDERLTSLGQLRGRPVLLTVINTWADPALYEVPRLKQVHEDHAKEGLAVLCVALDDTSETVRIFRDTFEIPYLVWMVEDRAWFSSDQGPLGPIDIIPTSFLIDRYGRVVGRVKGTWPEDVMERAVVRLLAADRSTQ